MFFWDSIPFLHRSKRLAFCASESAAATFSTKLLKPLRGMSRHAIWREIFLWGFWGWILNGFDGSKGFSYAGLIELDVHNCKAWEAWMHQLKVSLPIWPEVGQFCLGADLEPASWQWTGNYSFSLIKVYESEFVCERRQSMRKYVQHSATFRSYSWTGFMDWFTEMVNQVLPQPKKSLTTAGYPLVCST